MSYIQDYIRFCRPYLGRLLRAIRMDVNFHKGSRNHLFYHDDSGREVKVLDLLGGFGTGLFGHHQKDLADTLESCIRNRTPFNTQGSCRTKTATLGKMLSRIMSDSFGKEYVTTLTNTGTETVEAAIKHSLRVFGNKVSRQKKEYTKKLVLFKRAFQDGKFEISEDIRTKFNIRAGQDRNSAFDEICDFLLKAHDDALSCNPLFICLKRAFHGQTCGSVQLTHYKDYREHYEHIGPDTIFIDPTPESIEKAVHAKAVMYWDLKRSRDSIEVITEYHYPFAALFVEPVQGEGGIHPLSTEFLKACRKAAEVFNFPLVFDEIQCGMGRTGTFFNCIGHGVRPDYCLTAKSLGGGLVKIGAMLVERSMYDEEFGYLHNSTFVEDDLSSAVAIKAIELLHGSDNLMGCCRKMGDFLLAGLRGIQHSYPSVIRDVRGSGLMIGIEFERLDHSPSRALRSLSRQNLLVFIMTGYLLREHDIRVAPTMSDHFTMRLLPSAYLTEKDCLDFISALRKLCEIVDKRNLYRLTRYIVGLEDRSDASEVIDYRNTPDPAGVVKTDRDIPKVAFVNHFIQSEDMKLWDEGFSGFSDEEMRAFLDNTWEIMKPCFYDEFLIRSITGAEVLFKYIAIPLSSEIFESRIRAMEVESLRDLVEEGFELAADDGCTMVGFGGYTSIITRNCKTIVSEDAGATTGNALTVAMGLEALKQGAESQGIPLEKSCFAAVGAAGNIGSIYCQLFAENVPEIILITRPGGEGKLKLIADKLYFQALETIQRSQDNLSGIARRIADTRSARQYLQANPTLKGPDPAFRDMLERELGEKTPITIGTDLQLLKKADLILSASNSAAPVIFPEMLSDRPTIICDVSVPMDTDDSVSNKSNVTIIKGGIVMLPDNPEFKVKGIRLDHGQAFACMAETMILGLEGVTENFSYGDITPEQVKLAAAMAEKHGFKMVRAKSERSI